MSKQAVPRFVSAVFYLAAFIMAFYLYFLVDGKIFSAFQSVSVSQLYRAFA